MVCIQLLCRVCDVEDQRVEASTRKFIVTACGFARNPQRSSDAMSKQLHLPALILLLEDDGAASLQLFVSPEQLAEWLATEKEGTMLLK